MSVNHSWIGPCACCGWGWGWRVGVEEGGGQCAPTGATDGPTGTGTRQDGWMDG